ncbi:uncharacterized protein EI90DRAFT_3061753 [Cantharellus anzutake]|uniref:uncharacterized protein n=1 Tax=Cantharellus anzutake TaxID=1750568 RepID=UPI0019041602|nr:uncharacterized protein EI90DRAFT_3061753 [Cantharellus anzutake]KAF8329743.1 hypothetical protein EI90DRAFT_3061753 [Cantharellus anzutake]
MLMYCKVLHAPNDNPRIDCAKYQTMIDYDLDDHASIPPPMMRITASNLNSDSVYVMQLVCECYANNVTVNYRIQRVNWKRNALTQTSAIYTQHRDATRTTSTYAIEGPFLNTPDDAGRSTFNKLDRAPGAAITTSTVIGKRHLQTSITYYH